MALARARCRLRCVYDAWHRDESEKHISLGARTLVVGDSHFYNLDCILISEAGVALSSCNNDEISIKHCLNC